MKLFLIILSSSIGLMPLWGFGEDYKYIDKNGNVSFTDNILNVPEDQRQNAERRGDRQDSKERMSGGKASEARSSSKLSPKDLDLVKRLREAGLIDEKAVREMTPEKIRELKIMLKLSYGLEEDDVGKKDPRFSSPESTWSAHKQALIDGDIEGAVACFVPNSAEDYRRGYQMLGKEEMKKLAREMKPIEKITQDDHHAKYRITRIVEGKDITFYIEFVNVLGNWKIDQY